MNDTKPLLRVSGLTKQYDSLAGSVQALKGLDLTVAQGEFLVITGKSGAGKTTLVNMIAGLDRHSGGEIWVADTAVHQLSREQAAVWRRQNVGVVFQTFELLPGLTIWQNVTLPMDFAGRYPERERRTRALHLLEQVGIADHARKRPSAISGGQQQRVAIARALANDPPLIVADEPTGSLDSHTAAAVLRLFEDLAAAGKTVLLVTHDPDICRRASHAVTLVDGLIPASS